MTLTKAELADLLFEKVGLNKREAKDMVEAFFEEIRGALERGESVKLSGFGNFQLRDKPQRPGRNPKTGEEIPPPQPGQARGQPPLLPAPRGAADPPHPRAALRGRLHHQRRAQPPG